MQLMRYGDCRWLQRFVVLAVCDQRLKQSDRLFGSSAFQQGAGLPGRQRLMQSPQSFPMGCRPIGVAVLRQQLTGVELQSGPIILDRTRTQRSLRRRREHVGIDDEVTVGPQDHDVVLQAERVS
jgi:hypothetical protein